MSKLNMDVLRESITKMMTTKKKRGFTETVELQIMLKVLPLASHHLNRIMILRRTNDLPDPSSCPTSLVPSCASA